MSIMLRKINVSIAIMAVLFLNFASVIECGKMLIDNKCCHSTSSVKPCCVKNLKVTNEDRITGHCGCSVKQSQLPVDMYIDLASNLQKNYSNHNNDFELSSSHIVSNESDILTANYSPPLISVKDIYLSNLNLRI